MTNERHELDELTDRITNDADARARFITGFAGGEPDPQVVDAGEDTKPSAFAGAVATGALLFAAPAIASRVMLGQVGSGEPCILLICPVD